MPTAFDQVSARASPVPSDTAGSAEITARRVCNVNRIFHPVPVIMRVFDTRSAVPRFEF